MVAVLFQNQHAAHTAEDGHMAVAGVAVQTFAPFRGMHDVSVQVNDLGAYGKTVFRRVGFIVRMLQAYGEQVALQGHRRPMLGAEVQHWRHVGAALLLQLVLFEKGDVAGAVVVDGGPFTADVQVHRAVAGQVDVQALDVIFDQVEVVAVGLQVDAAVEDVGGVGVAGYGYGEAPALGGVDAPRPGAQVEGVLFHVAVLQVDDRHHAGLAVADEQAAHDLPFAVLVGCHHFAMLVPVIVVQFGRSELHGVDALAQRDYLRLVGTGVVHQLLQPAGLKMESDSQHQVRVRDLGNVAGSRHEGMRIASRRNHAENFHPVSAYHPGPVSHEVRGCHHLHRWPVGRGGLRGNRCVRRLGRRCNRAGGRSLGGRDRGTRRLHGRLGHCRRGRRGAGRHGGGRLRLCRWLSVPVARAGHQDCHTE